MGLPFKLNSGANTQPQHNQQHLSPSAAQEGSNQAGMAVEDLDRLFQVSVTQKPLWKLDGHIIIIVFR
jgi:hypothetical protein